VSTRLPGTRPKDARLSPCVGAWTLLTLLFACATGTPRGSFVAHRYNSLTPPPAPKDHVVTTQTRCQTIRRGQGVETSPLTPSPATRCASL
jgi:hypothetical protein